jgi:hypothetical protein
MEIVPHVISDAERYVARSGEVLRREAEGMRGMNGLSEDQSSAQGAGKPGRFTAS